MEKHGYGDAATKDHRLAAGSSCGRADDADAAVKDAA
jgi:hypothetical protein